MASSNRIAQAYGYAVCFIAVVTILVSTSAIVKSLFDLSDPLRAEGYGRGVSLTSFSAYKRDQAQRNTGPAPARVPATTDSVTSRVSDSELRQMFEDERLDQVGAIRFRSMKTLVSSVLMIAVAIVLFLIHWRWLRQEDLKA